MKDVRSDGVDHKFKGNVSGHTAMLLLIVIFILSVCSITVNFHFKGDIFITLLLVEIFEICKETYRGYREREV